VSAGKLLGFLVSHRDIEANPAKIKAIEAMRPPGRIKDVQKLTGSLAALSRFISRLAERALGLERLNKPSRSGSSISPHCQYWWLQSQVRRCFCILLRLQRRSAWCWSPRGWSKLARGTPGSPRPRMVGQTPDMGVRQPLLCLKVRTPDKGVRRSLVPAGAQNRWGPKDLTWWIRASRTRWPGSEPSRSQSTTSAKSSTRQRPGILSRISLSMPYLLRPGNCATIFKHTELSY